MKVHQVTVRAFGWRLRVAYRLPLWFGKLFALGVGFLMAVVAARSI